MRFYKVIIILGLFIFIGLGLFVSQSGAQTSITLSNPSFESPSVASPGYSFTCSGWTCSNNGNGLIVVDGGLNPFTVAAPDGTQALFTNGLTNVWQTIPGMPGTIVNGATYTLNVWVGEAQSSYDSSGSAGITIQLLACSTGCSNTGAENQGPPGVVIATETISGPGYNTWVDAPNLTYTGTALTAGETLGINLLGPTGSGFPVQQTFVDDVTLTSMSAAPEPTTVLLYGTGLLLIGGVMRRKRIAKLSVAPHC